LCFLIKVPAVDETLGAAVYLCFPKRVRRELATENESKDPEGFSSTSYWIRAFSQHLGSVAACLPERESRELATENESKDPEGFSSIGVTPSIETVGNSLGYRSLKLARRTRLLVAA
jgi:hypothetical protein